MRSTTTTRHGAVATGGASEGATPPRPLRQPETLSVMSTPAPGWLRSGPDRLVPLPPALQPYVGPENRSQFLDAQRLRVRVVRFGGGRR